MNREMSSSLDITVTDPAQLVFQIAVARLPGADITDELRFISDGRTLEADQIMMKTGTRMHIIDAPVGHLQVRYQATVRGRFDPTPVTTEEVAEYLRPSRYVESDRFDDVGAELFGSIGKTAELLTAVAAWVGNKLSYVPGSSGPMDGATDTMDAAMGVCRDYAHLVAALLRARGVPARIAAVYAPGCDPMDFHAVVEAEVNQTWQVVDSTLLAPRSGLVRIATGRDAADTAFMANNGGSVTLDNAVVTAVVDGALPTDDVAELVRIG